MFQANQLNNNQYSIQNRNPNLEQRSKPPSAISNYDLKFSPFYNNRPEIYQNKNTNEQNNYNYINNNQYIQNSNQGMIPDNSGYQGGNNIYNNNNNYNNKNSYTNTQQIYYSNNINQNMKNYQNQFNQDGRNTNRFKIVAPQMALNLMIKGNYSNNKFKIAVPQELLTFTIKGNISNNIFRNIIPISNLISKPMQSFSINPQKNIGIKMINSQNNVNINFKYDKPYDMNVPKILDNYNKNNNDIKNNVNNDINYNNNFYNSNLNKYGDYNTNNNMNNINTNNYMNNINTNNYMNNINANNNINNINTNNNINNINTNNYMNNINTNNYMNNINTNNYMNNNTNNNQIQPNIIPKKIPFQYNNINNNQNNFYNAGNIFANHNLPQKSNNIIIPLQQNNQNNQNQINNNSEPFGGKTIQGTIITDENKNNIQEKKISNEVNSELKKNPFYTGNKNKNEQISNKKEKQAPKTNPFFIRKEITFGNNNSINTSNKSAPINQQNNNIKFEDYKDPLSNLMETNTIIPEQPKEVKNEKKEENKNKEWGNINMDPLASAKVVETLVQSEDNKDITKNDEEQSASKINPFHSPNPNPFDNDFNASNNRPQVQTENNNIEQQPNNVKFEDITDP